jgi:hypothetical protein
VSRVPIRTLNACVVVALAAPLAVSPAAADPGATPAIPPHHAEYVLTRDGLPFGVMTIDLDIDDRGGYRYRAHTEPHVALALMNQALELADGVTQTEESIGRLEAGRFRPSEYRFRREGTAAVRGLDLTFDWQRRRARIVSEGKPWSMHVPDGAQDKLSVLLALRQDLNSTRDEISYNVADGGRLKTYRFRVLGPQSLPGPGGDRDTLALERYKDDREVDYRLWTAPGLHQLPVRVEREEGGSLFVMELTRVEGEASADGGGEAH